MLWIRRAMRKLGGRAEPFNSRAYWEDRYQANGTSGAGSYGRLATYKADFLNRFVETHGIERVLELGCGDGNQLSMAQYRCYAGFDVAASAVAICAKRFARLNSWKFYQYSPALVSSVSAELRPQLALSLDVIFHLVEDDVFNEYMRTLFSTGSKYVIVYSSNGNCRVRAEHMRNMKFTDWIEANSPEWMLIEHEKNPYPWDEKRPDETSFCDFYAYERSPA